MTFRQALVELGIEELVEREQVRRAYLRTLKTRSPERDPAGFKRLREAYELVDSFLASRVAMHVAAAAVQPPTDRASTELAVATSVDKTPAPSPDSSAAPGPAGPELDGTPTGDPVSSGPSWASTVAAFDAAATAPAESVPPFAEAMQQILALIETSDLDGAEAVRASIQRWISAHGGGARLMSPRLAVAWTMVGELGDAAPDLTPAARAALAGAIRGEDLRLARPGVRRGIADQLAVLRARAPTIARALERSEPEVSKTPSGRQGRATLAIPIIVALTVVFRFLAHQEDAPPRYELGSDELRRSTSIPASFDGMAADSIKIRDLSLVRGGPALGAAAVAMARASRARDCAGLQAAAPELHRLASAADGKDADTSEVKLEIKSIAEGLMRTIAERCSSPASSSTP